MPVHLLHLVQGMSVGGLELVVKRLVESLDPAIFRTTVCCFDTRGELAPDLEKQGIEVVHLPRRPGLDWQYLFRLARLLRRKSVDLVHLHNDTALFYGVLAARLAGTRGIVYTEHDRALPDRRRIRVLNRLLATQLDHAAAVSSILRDGLETSEGFNVTRLSVIHNGVPGLPTPRAAAVRAARLEMGARDEDILLGTVGRLSDVKDHAGLIDAMRHFIRGCPSARLAIVGGGELHGPLQRQIEDGKLQHHVKLVGAKLDVTPYLCGMDVFVLPSKSEGMPLAVLEAMAAGKPVVATRVGGLGEVIRDGVDGYLVPPGDYMRLFQRIGWLVDHPHERAEMGKRAHTAFQERFSLEKSVDKYVRVYESALRKPLRHGAPADARRYRILYHQRTQDPDGQRVHIHAMQKALRGMGHDVSEVSLVAATEPAGIRGASAWTHVLAPLIRSKPKGVYDVLEWGYNLVGFIKLALAIRRIRPDFIYERYALNTLAGVWASKCFRIPLFLEVNSPLAEERRLTEQVGFYSIARRIESYVMRRATRVLAVSDVLRRRMAMQCAMAPEQFIVNPNGVDIEAFRCSDDVRRTIRRKLGVDRFVVIGCVGFFREWHGVEQLIAWLAEDPSVRDRVRLLLVGDGPATPVLKDDVRRYGLEGCVHFLGSLPHDSVNAPLAALDIAVIPRATEYASPLKLFEYMAAAKPVLAPRQANVLEIVTEGVDALCFAPENVQELGGQLRRLIDDECLRGRIGASARDTVSKRGLTWNDSAARVVSAFESLRPLRQAVLEVARS